MSYHNKVKSQKLQNLLDEYNLILTEIFDYSNFYAVKQIISQAQSEGFTDMEIRDVQRRSTDYKTWS
jgi:hypothetical protein